MVMSIVAAAAIVPCVWLLGSLAGVAAKAAAGEARIHLTVRRLTRESLG
ncbi:MULTISPECIES: hypothetical protein [Dactylosporangium]|uniref:Uncharacterized protein n=2 Tax=Dactylosporangium TaxID=35753 RepID=A0A9W6KJE2_9ACTN|nr:MULTISPECIES: hypothetical protein [Dactylosporangium]UAC00598.1 hypothetical protein Dvina_22630 [Dactylosporangium vinaceum]UWZ48164.1 hypothetical protein Dmats_18210 [Dactylosporangium matsuzakiense]GLL03182.1 hypothetical protein GCM10017581_049250 [Dactylosporangium matsuzakiense]